MWLAVCFLHRSHHFCFSWQGKSSTLIFIQPSHLSRFSSIFMAVWKPFLWLSAVICHWNGWRQPALLGWVVWKSSFAVSNMFFCRTCLPSCAFDIMPTKRIWDLVWISCEPSVYMCLLPVVFIGFSFSIHCLIKYFANTIFLKTMMLQSIVQSDLGQALGIIWLPEIWCKCHCRKRDDLDYPDLPSLKLT